MAFFYATTMSINSSVGLLLNILVLKAIFGRMLFKCR